jgi:FlaA1/EpsC-like NDP-sugar epimerase
LPLTHKRVLVTGACGTIGRELVHQLLAGGRVAELVALDNNESELFALEQCFNDRSEASFFLADVRDRRKLISKMKGIDVVFHTAAFKHVTLCERSPFEAVQTNIMGVQNVIAAAIDQKVARVIFTSSDKAVNPTNVMGTSKLMGERLMTAANSNLRGDGPIFSSTRFGNVLGSRGSVVTIFREQIRQGGPLTLTDPAMTRFIMSIGDAVRLVVDSAGYACGGEVFITKMRAVKIETLARVMIRELAPQFRRRPEQIEVQVIGAKPGEKMYEELLNREETRRTLELADYFVVLPAFKNLYRNISYTYPDIVSEAVLQPYQSESQPLMSEAELARFLKQAGLMACGLNTPGDARCGS